MKFILDNPAILLVLVALAARFLRRRSVANRAASAGAPAAAGQEDERTRRVREEVQRRIAERRAAAAPPPVVARAAPAPVPPARPPPPVSDIEAVLAEQRAIAEEIRALDRAKPVFGRAPVAAAAGAPAREAGLPGLGSPQAARQAIVLREVLGPPRGLTLEGCLWR